MVIVVLFGPPGSGKGTQAEKLSERFNLKHVSTGDLFRHNIGNKTDLGLLAKSYMDKGDLVPDEVTSNMLKDHLQNNSQEKGFILDGYPRTIQQAESLDTMLEELFGTEVNLTLSLDVEDDVLINRLLERGKVSGRSDDANEDVIKNRLQEYYNSTAPVADFYQKQGKLVKVEGTGEIDEITDELSEEINKNL